MVRKQMCELIKLLFTLGLDIACFVLISIILFIIIIIDFQIWNELSGKGLLDFQYLIILIETLGLQIDCKIIVLYFNNYECLNHFMYIYAR